MTLPRRSLLIDTDTASDDAVALIMALRSPLIDVVAITTVAGNVAVAQATSNALYTAELCDSAVPVYPGAEAPIARPLEDATWFHGKDGLGDHDYMPKHRLAEKTHAVDAILAAIHAYPELEIVTLGPLTNLARVLQREPSIASTVRRCVVMGGAPCCEGNVTPAAEYNMWVDPEAARLVLASGLRTELIGWQLSRHDAVLGAGDIDTVLALGTPYAEFAVQANSAGASAYLHQTGERGISLPDPIAMAILLEPALCLEASDHYVAVEVASPLTRGMTVVDRLNVAHDARNRAVWRETFVGAKPSSICWRLDVRGWKAALLRALA